MAEMCLPFYDLLEKTKLTDPRISLHTHRNPRIKTNASKNMNRHKHLQHHDLKLLKTDFPIPV